MKRFTGNNFSATNCSRTGSWEYVRNDFTDEFSALKASGAFFRGSNASEIIWETRNKFVLKVSRPPQSGAAGSVVFKSFRRIAKWHKYFLRRSPGAREALNYRIMADAGMPMAEMLAAGDVRRCGILQNTFLVTLFAEGFSNGRDFVRNGTLQHEHRMRDEFIRRNLAYLARLHSRKVIHNGFTPANLLYKINAENEMEFCWIDVASCKKLFTMSERHIAKDIALFFSYFPISAVERKEFLET